jgi:putative nucleotidyltransferase with HDIG domain
MARGAAVSKYGAARAHEVVLLIVSLGLALSTGVALSRLPSDHLNGLSVVLGLAALASGLAVAPTGRTASISASFLVVALAAVFLGPASAWATAALAEAVAAWRRHTGKLAIAINLFGMTVPAVAAAVAIQAIEPSISNSVGFYATVGAVAAWLNILSYALIAPIHETLNHDGAMSLRTFFALAPSIILNVALVVAGAAIYVKVGLPGIAFALTAVFAFSYMAHLLEQSRRRAQQYVSLSWGVLAGLMRSLDIRDERAARHAAAVARFARDMAESVGMTEQEQELAHTAGLLHDIGHFALSDRVAERGRTLTEEDWMAIQRHPELGADMLRDLGMYGPVAEIVLAHHERIDGRGYPRGLTGDEIPEIAKIISVAELYDTLTASDTYRTKMSSFEALRELQRVAGSQLDARYVEVLAGLLSGEGVEYRHADAADFDTELDMERRIKEAGAG